MRPLALLGLVVSLAARRDRRDRSPTAACTPAATSRIAWSQEAVNSETALIANGERQTTTALSLLLVNPAVSDLLSGRRSPRGRRRTDLAESTRWPSPRCQRSAFVPVSAACLDDGSGRQLVCGPTARPADFPPSLGRQFAAARRQLSRRSRQRRVPLTGQPAVLGRLPRAVPRPRIGCSASCIWTSASPTRAGASLIVNDTPGVDVQLADLRKGPAAVRRSPRARSRRAEPGRRARCRSAALEFGSQPQIDVRGRPPRDGRRPAADDRRGAPARRRGRARDRRRSRLPERLERGDGRRCWRSRS